MEEEKPKEEKKFILSEEEAGIAVQNLAQVEDYQLFLKVTNGQNIAKLISEIQQVAQQEVKPVAATPPPPKKEVKPEPASPFPK